MPWSPKQHRLFEGVAHGTIKGSGIKTSDAKRMAGEGILGSLYKKKKKKKGVI